MVLRAGVEELEAVNEGYEEVEKDEDDEIVVDELHDGAPPVAHEGEEASEAMRGVLVLVAVPGDHRVSVGPLQQAMDTRDCSICSSRAVCLASGNS